MVNISYSFKYDGRLYTVKTTPSTPFDPKILKNLIQKGRSIDELYILDVGQDQLTHKAYYCFKEMERFGIHTCYFASDRYGIGQENEKEENLIVSRMKNRSIPDWIEYIKLICKYKPIHIEMFLGMRSWDLVFYALIAKLLCIPLVVKCRGGELRYWEQHSLRRRLADTLVMKASCLITVRELFMPKVIVEHKITNLKKVVLIHNHVPVPEDYNKEYDNTILFLNSLVNIREPLKLINIANELKKHNVDFQMFVVGFTEGKLTSHGTVELEKRFQELASSNELKDRFILQNFTNNTVEWFKKSSIFIIPSPEVYCNNSLIEAMSYKCVPIVGKGKGGELIIEDGVSGYLLHGDAGEYVDKIEALLADKNKLQVMGCKARERIQEEYDANRQAEMLLAFYAEYVWINNHNEKYARQES